MFTLDAFCRTAPLPAPTAAAIKPLRVVDEFSDSKFLPAGVDLARMRFVRARDVQVGDLVIGLLPNPFLAVGDARPHALRYPFVSTGARVITRRRSCDCRMCAPETADAFLDLRAEYQRVHLGRYAVAHGQEPAVHCAVYWARQFMCVIPSAHLEGQAFTLADTGEQRALSPRPLNETYEPLPYGLTLGDAVAVRAREVAAGDVVVAVFGAGANDASAHVPSPYVADPHSLAGCPCEECEECDDMDAWTMADPAREADLGWRFVCLAPSEDGEPCEIWPSARAVVVLCADVVERARAAAEEGQDAAEEAPVREYGVMWSADFEASSPQEAARLAYEQLLSYAEDGDAWAPVLEVEDEDGRTTIVDLHEQAEEGQ
ncbi:hypothetical protein [Streptomyces sp. BH055]|uniref:hypothetical protein n=1 Tax=unclassified Streptomyces TaxID=2593676 RepID=UPI003BB7033E